MKVAVVGAGRLARALVRRLPDDIQVVVIVRHPPTRPLPRGDVIFSTDPAAAAGAAVVFPAVPAEEVAAAIAAVTGHLEASALICNVATDLATSELTAAFPGRRIVATKFVGQAGELEAGSPGAVVVHGATDAELELLRHLLAPLGAVIRADEAIVLAVNTAIAEEVVRAEAAMRARLAELGAPPELAQAAVATMAVGSLRAIATGTAGPFLRRVASRLS